MTALEKAMRCKNTTDRKWLGPVHLDSYMNISNRVSFYVLEGSPIHGIIIVRDNVAIRCDSMGKRMRTYYD